VITIYIKRLGAVSLVAFLSSCSMPSQSSLPPEALSSVQAVVSPAFDPIGIGPTKAIGTSVPGWANIPIMPGAYNSELEDMVYLYSVSETVDAVEEYYQTKMSVNGWTLTSRQILETSSSGPSTILNFQKNNKYLNVMLVNVPDENATAVILSQLGQ
jgi:hypothetical protein